MRAGGLNRRIAIRRGAQVSDGKGGFTTSWSTIAEAWAEAVSQNGREAVIAQALQGVSAYRITIRRRTDVFEGDQILYRPPGAAAALELNIKSAADHHEHPDAATTILADTEAPRGA